MTADYVSTRFDDRGIATVTLDNPDRHNAFDALPRRLGRERMRGPEQRGGKQQGKK